MAEESSEPPELPGPIQLPGNYSLQKLPLEIPLGLDESISCISSYDANLYIGTTAGQILHYFIFDNADEYILILQLQVLPTEKFPVKKFVILPDIDMCLVLSNRVIYPFTLPELSPCHIGKIKDANDMSQLSQVKNPKVKNKHDKIIVFTSTKIRVVQLLTDSVKLLRDINYAGAELGFSSAAGTLANYSNICLVANEKNYDVVDLQQTRRISLFEYNPSQLPGVDPHIVPFTDEDSGKEEYMLTICSDKSNSMAMFMNSLGDVTRGTLVWTDAGYPFGGVAVQWPYIIGLFRAENDTRLTFSSLLALDVTFSVDFQEFAKQTMSGADFETTNLVRVDNGVSLTDLGLLDLVTPVNLAGVASLGYQKQFIKLNIIFSGRSSLHCLYQGNELVLVINSIQEALEKELEADIEELLLKLKESDSPPGFESKVKLATLLVLGKFEEVKSVFSDENISSEFDPRLFLLRDDKYPDDDEVWTEFVAEKAILSMVRISNGKGLDPKFKLWLLQRVHSQKEAYTESIWQYFRKLLYEDSTSVEHSIELARIEQTLWQDQSEDTRKLFPVFEKRRDYLTIFTILEFQQDHQDTQETACAIIDLGLSVLSGSSALNEQYKLDQGTLIAGSVSKNLVQLVFFQLRNHIHDSEEYTKKLLELLKLFPDQGLELLQANKGGEHLSTHRYILQELSSTHNIDKKFSSLKVEYLEQTFLEQLAEKQIDEKLADELLSELLLYLESNMDMLSDAFENLNILRATFKIEVDLAEPNWPKLSWVEFLYLHGRKDVSKDLVEIYLKVYELLLIKSLNNATIQTISIDNEAFQYLIKCFTETSVSNSISYLLDWGDYLAIEWVGVYGKMPCPRKAIYFEEVRQQVLDKFEERPQEAIKTSIHQILKFYLDLEDSKSKHFSVNHLVSRFGKYFNMTELLTIIPENFPIIYIQEYLTLVFVELDAHKSHTVIRKSLSKLDAKFTEQVFREFEAETLKLAEVSDLASS